MIINLKRKYLLTIALLINVNAFAGEKSVISAVAPESEINMSFWDLPLLKEAFVNTSPELKSDGLSVGTLGKDGGNEAQILALAKEIADDKHGNYDSLLISQNGKLLFESYYKRGRSNLPHIQFSTTKAYTALALGRAMQLGYLSMDDLDKPLIGFLKGLDSTKFVKGIENITLHKALTMSSGLRFNTEQMTEFGQNPDKYKGIAQIQAFFENTQPITVAEQTYKYQGPDPIMIMQVIDTVVPGGAKDFIQKEILEKLEINNYTWRDDKSGLPVAYSGASMMSRDMVKFGELVINDGEWEGEQLLPKPYLIKATSAVTQTKESWQPKSFSYGYLWYQTDLTVKGKSYDVNVAWGAGGNRIIIVKKLGLVAVITGHDQEDKIFPQVSKFILPAFAK